MASDLYEVRFGILGRWQSLQLAALPPYPINDKRHLNVVDGKLVSNIINALLELYEKIELNELLWAYWFAVCAPIHSGAASFGSLIEQLQTNSKEVFSSVDRTLLAEEKWQDLKKNLLKHIRAVDADADLLKIIASKASLLNEAPQRLVLQRLFEELALSMSEAEADAWKHRNAAAHGTSYGDPIETILKTKLLRLLFHRMIAKMTNCSDRYVDYYSLEHPTRPLDQPVPERLGQLPR